MRRLRDYPILTNQVVEPATTESDRREWRDVARGWWHEGQLYVRRAQRGESDVMSNLARTCMNVAIEIRLFLRTGKWYAINPRPRHQNE